MNNTLDQSSGETVAECMHRRRHSGEQCALRASQSGRSRLWGEVRFATRCCLSHSSKGDVRGRLGTLRGCLRAEQL